MQSFRRQPGAAGNGWMLGWRREGVVMAKLPKKKRCPPMRQGVGAYLLLFRRQAGWRGDG